jgi:hypothetical protein
MRTEHAMAAAVTALIAIAFLVAIVLMVRDCSRQEDCTDKGGRIERYNHRTMWVAQSCGKNCTVMVPHQVSDWRCVDMPAEVQP